MKILFVTLHMRTGGIKRSLLNLLDEMKSYQEIIVDVLVLHGELNEVRQVLAEYNVRNIYICELTNCYYTSFANQKGIVKKKIKIACGIFSRILGRENVIKILVNSSRRFDGYDIAISYSNGIWTNGTRKFSGGCEFYVLNKVKARRKYAWIHSNPKNLGFTKELCDRVYKPFDKIINVSIGCKNIFDEICPDLIEKSVVVHNLCNYRRISELSLAENPYGSYSGFKIVTVCRVDNKSKRIDKIVNICKILLKNTKCEFKWFIVGDGNDREWLEKLSAAEGTSSELLFVGMKDNPYPYVKYADLFVLNSDYEAFPLSVKESLLLNTPVVCTPIPSATELIDNGETGYIQDFSVESMAERILSLMEDKHGLKKLKYNLRNQDKNDDFYEFLNLING